jgi:ABC-2 type transport system permease protein
MLVRTEKSDERSGQMAFIPQVVMMTARAIKTTFRVPAAVIPGILISVFFLLVYNSSLGNASGYLPGLAGNSYLVFILPVSIISSALSGASIAGESIVRDIENGYFDKLLLTPINRGALLLGAMIAGAFILLLQSVFVLIVGLLMGLESATGLGGILVVMGFALLLDAGFSGLTVGVALRTGSGAATQGSSFLFFPMTFLTATFVPISLLSGWIKVAAQYNPITYVLEAMRSVLLVGWEADVLLRGLSSCLALGAVLFVFALLSLRSRTQRR